MALTDLAVFDDLPLGDLRRKYNANINVATVQNGAIFVRALEENLVRSPAKSYPKSGEELTLSLSNDRLYFKGAVRKVFETTVA